LLLWRWSASAAAPAPATRNPQSKKTDWKTTNAHPHIDPSGADSSTGISAHRQLQTTAAIIPILSTDQINTNMRGQTGDSGQRKMA
jgi:hypothetical protein